jgi:hypothetical protein
VCALAVNEHAETILEGQVSVLGVVELLFESGAKGRQPESSQFVEQRLTAAAYAGRHGYE